MSVRPTFWNRQPWIYRPGADSLFILFPAFLATAIVALFPGFFRDAQQMPPWAWLLLIVGIDVAHVYSTLWRTYFDKGEFGKYRKQLIWIPVLSFGAGFALYAIDGMLFWRLLAYLAVYHFVRQQYGFFSIYARKEGRGKWERRLDAFAIYSATIYPLLYWHTHLPRNFSWFMEGDFLAIHVPWLSSVGGGVYACILLAYIGKEMYLAGQGRGFNLPKNLILLGTVVSWYYGIVIRNGDLAFTATNVIAHGIPYMALVWMYGKKKQEKAPPERKWWQNVFRWQYIPVFLGVLLLFAYFEEGLWDALVWRDHEGLFPWASGLPIVAEPLVLAIVVPLLTLPQVTHYVIDGFIWKVRREGADLKAMD